jgi:hypothetical protein
MVGAAYSLTLNLSTHGSALAQASQDISTTELSMVTTEQENHGWLQVVSKLLVCYGGRWISVASEVNFFARLNWTPTLLEIGVRSSRAKINWKRFRLLGLKRELHDPSIIEKTSRRNEQFWSITWNRFWNARAPTKDFFKLEYVCSELPSLTLLGKLSELLDTRVNC